MSVWAPLCACSLYCFAWSTKTDRRMYEAIKWLCADDVHFYQSIGFRCKIEGIEHERKKIKEIVKEKERKSDEKRDGKNHGWKEKNNTKQNQHLAFMTGSGLVTVGNKHWILFSMLIQLRWVIQTQPIISIEFCFKSKCATPTLNSVWIPICGYPCAL